MTPTERNKWILLAIHYVDLAMQDESDEECMRLAWDAHVLLRSLANHYLAITVTDPSNPPPQAPVRGRIISYDEDGAPIREH